MSILRLKGQVQSGFTILELMIASSIFSVVLLVIAAGILSISQNYSKGINATNTQTTARAVMSNVTQHIQFGSVGSSPLTVNGSAGGYCINNTTYSFVPGQKVDATHTGLVEANNVGCSATTLANVYTPTTLPSTDTYQDLLGAEMRVAQLDVTPNGSGSYTVSLKIAYGDTDDMFIDDTGQTPSAIRPNSWPTAHCRNQAGQHFCATSQLTTTVQQRL